MRSFATSPADNASQNRKTESTVNVSEQTSPDGDIVSGRAQKISHALSQTIWLPHSVTTFAFFIITLAVLCGGLFLHINLSAHITQTQYDIAVLEDQHLEIERENAEITAQIAIATSMFDIHTRAMALGYIPVTSQYKNFVAVADIQSPQYGLAAAPLQTDGEDSTFALTDNNSVQTQDQADFFDNALASNAEDTGVLLVTSESASLDMTSPRDSIDLEVNNQQQQQSITGSLGSWLRNLWSND